jgi:hypothetical protein
MKPLVLSIAATVLVAAPALAQYGGDYGGGSYGGGGYGRSYDDDDDDYPRRRRPPPPPYGRPDPYGQPGYGPPARRMGSVCITARGNCPWRPSPINAPCGCDIPGFGFKRGAVGGSFSY